MTLANDLKSALRQIRALPGMLGLRPYSVAINLRAWSGANPGEGAETVTSLALTEADGQPPRVRYLTLEELAVGALPAGSVEVGPITPADSTGSGYSIAQLLQTAATDNNIRDYTLTGPEFPNGARFRLHKRSTDRALNFRLTLVPLTDS